MLIFLLKSLQWSSGSCYSGESTPHYVSPTKRNCKAWMECLEQLSGDSEKWTVAGGSGRKPDFEVSPLDSEFASFFPPAIRWPDWTQSSLKLSSESIEANNELQEE